MNVVFSVTYIPPTYIGGGQTYIYYLTKELYKLGVNIKVFTSKPSVTSSSEWDWSHARICGCKPILRVSNTPIMPTLFPKMVEDDAYDIVHTDVPQAYSCDVSALVSQLKRKPLIITYHCDLLPSLISKIYSIILSKYTLERADKIIATTRSYSKTSPLLSRFMKKVEVIPMGIDLERFSVRNRQKFSKDIRDRHDIGEDEYILLFVGGLNNPHKYKRVDILINAFSGILERRSDVRLIIVGEGELRRSYEDLCSRLGIKNKVIFTGYVSNEELPKYYCVSDLFVLPSLTREEAFGIVLLEAAACGSIPICFDIPGPSEVCKEVGGFVAPIGDPVNELKKLILEVLIYDLDESKNTCAERVKKYTWRNIASKTLEIYEKVMK